MVDNEAGPGISRKILLENEGITRVKDLPLSGTEAGPVIGFGDSLGSCQKQRDNQERKHQIMENGSMHVNLVILQEIRGQSRVKAIFPR
jgi:hypothetical protein